MENSPLARLPAELRNYIYALALSTPTPVHLGHREPPICRTCRQLRNESSFIHYNLNNVVLHLTSYAGSAQISPDSSTIDLLGGERLRQISSLHIRYEFVCDAQRPSQTSQAQFTYLRLSVDRICGVLAHAGLNEKQVKWEVVPCWGGTVEFDCRLLLDVEVKAKTEPSVERLQEVVEYS